jgi:glycosyltransferase involved in cell wall biosynthesis
VNLGEPRNSKYVPQAISAIIPTYNRAWYVAEAINSVLNQTLPPHEVIVVDDGSVDSTREVLKSFGSRIHVIRKSNGGKSSALNVGLAHARGEFIWIFDDDDVALPDCLGRLFVALTEHPNCSFAYGSYDHLIEGPAGETEVVDPGLQIDKGVEFRLSVLERCYIFQPGMLVRRSVFDEVGPFNEAMIRSQDYEMLLRITRRFSGVDVDSVVFHQRQHAGIRGTENAPVAKGKVEATWIKYDDLIFSRVYETYPLSEYLPTPRDGDLSDAEARYALLERSCIMARKGMWSRSAADLKEYAGLVCAKGPFAIERSERPILRRFFGPFSYADSKLAESDEFFSVVREISPRGLRWRIAAELLTPIAGELGYGIRRGYVRYVLGTTRKCLLFLTKYLGARRRRDQTVGVVSGMESR